MTLFNPNRLVISGLMVSLIFVVLIGIALAKTPLAGANGRVVQFTRHSAGPYELVVGTIPDPPVVGGFHMTMNVIGPDNNIPIIDADVVVVGVGPTDPENLEAGPAQLGPIAALNSPDDPTFYDINTALSREGPWVFTITVNAELGEGSTEIPLEATEASPLPGIVTMVTLVVFVTILGLSVRTFLRERGRRRQQQSNNE